jgi:hypothetical protein
MTKQIGVRRPDELRRCPRLVALKEETMELLLALVAVAVVLLLARSGFLHPGDYVVAAALAVLLALFTVVVMPDPQEARVLAPLGAPRVAVERAEFLLAHGVKIVVASVLVAVAASVAALVRRRLTPERYA